MSDIATDIAALRMLDKPATMPGKPNTANEYDVLQDALGALDDRYDGKGLRTTVIGIKLRGVQGRMIGALRLVNTGQTRTRAVLWSIVIY